MRLKGLSDKSISKILNNIINAGRKKKIDLEDEIYDEMIEGYSFLLDNIHDALDDDINSDISGMLIDYIAEYGIGESDRFAGVSIDDIDYDRLANMIRESHKEEAYGEIEKEEEGKPSDNVVEDPNTGLIWERSYDSNLTWYEAMKRPNELNAEEFEGFTDWRLPSKKELKKLWKSHIFPDQGWWWSSSPYVNKADYTHSADYAYYVSFNYGGERGYRKDETLDARCVRG